MIELMVTLSVFAILAVMAAPSFSAMMIGNRIVAQTNELIAALHFARSEAIKLNRSVTFCKLDTETSNACSSVSGTWAFWGVLSPHGVVRRGSIPPGNGLLVGTNLPASGLTFKPDGLAYVGASLADHRLEVWSCGAGRPQDNLNTIGLGAGSRLAITKSARGC
nr:GspH/FimT family pseudopilin [Crenobacter intestini]